MRSMFPGSFLRDLWAGSERRVSSLQGMRERSVDESHRCLLRSALQALQLGTIFYHLWRTRGIILQSLQSGSIFFRCRRLNSLCVPPMPCWILSASCRLGILLAVHERYVSEHFGESFVPFV